MPRKKQSKARAKEEPQVLDADDPLLKLDKRQRIAAMILADSGYVKDGGRRTGSVILAAREAKVHRDTIYLWLEKDEFVDAVEAHRASLIFGAFQCVRNSFHDLDTKAALKILEVQLPDIFDTQLRRQKQAQEHERELERERQQHTEKLAAQMPVLVYNQVVSMPDPDDGERPEGWEEFVKE